jgi:hypothetical protein
MPQARKTAPRAMRDKGIIAIDIGTRASAFAYAYPGDQPVCGHASFIEELATPAEVFHAFGCWIECRFDEFRPAYFVREKLWVARGGLFNMKTTSRLLGMDAVALREAQRRAIKVCEWSIKEVAAFHGTAGLDSKTKKRITFDTMTQRYGFKPATFDESDAQSVFVFAELQLSPQTKRFIGPLFAKEITQNGQ